MVRALLLTCAVTLTLALGAAHAQSPQGGKTASARWQDGPPSRDDLPPLSRGPQLPLYLANSGLRSGSAQVRAGTRIFGLCWNSGTGPYSVELRDPSGAPILQEKEIAETTLIKASQPVTLAPGLYTVLVTDQTGQNSEGHFQVAPLPGVPVASDSARDDGVVTDETLQLANLGAAWRYEAFLTLLPQQSQMSPEDSDLQKRLCHR